MTKVKLNEESFGFLIFKITLLVCFLGFCNPLARAQYFTGPISSALGGTGRAATEAEEGQFLNPAILPHAREFSSAIFYADGELGKGFGETVMGIGFIDNTEGVIVPGGFSYLKKRRTFPDKLPVDEQYGLVAIGGFLARHFTGGLSVHYRDIVEEGGLDASVWNSTLGLLFAPRPDWGIGLTWDHFLTRESDKLPTHLRDIPELGLGAVYFYNEIFRFRFDVAKALEKHIQKKYRFGFGIETFTSSFLAVRVGAERDEIADKTFVSAGWAFAGPRLKLDYSFKNDVRNGNGAMHSVDFRVPF
ncbi:MAG: hypothetical protein IPL83_16720 [Bdellovibrionales bacterium]|nr:hypothetical protein [Bdellovibrionales bacterium]